VECAGGSAEACFWFGIGLIPGGKLGKLAKGPANELVDAIKAGIKDHADEAENAVRSSGDVLESTGAACRAPNSFDVGTLVLMADGSREPIEDVEVGDLVMASDPVTGEQGPRRVTNLIRHSGLHRMVDVEFSNGDQVDATDEHPFWVESKHAWVDAIDLEAGDVLVNADRATLTVEHINVSRYDLTAYNLTVTGLHTYYVSASEILVHNAGDDSPVGMVFRDGQYKFQIFSNDHAPAHGHLQGPGIKGHGIQIGQNGKPLDPNIQLSAAQQRVVDDNLNAIRKSIRGYMKWYKQNPSC
jgi:hypothetical protein